MNKILNFDELFLSKEDRDKKNRQHSDVSLY
jgi:hypothetical protein